MVRLMVLILIAVILVIGYFLFAPFYVEIDTEKDLVQFRFHRLASAQFRRENSSLEIEIRIFWWRRQSGS
jgi:hypothetical protein